LTISAIVCAHNEEAFIATCLYSLLAQTRVPDEILVIDNASSDRTGDVARRVPGVRVVAEPRKGLVRARERGRHEASGNYRFYDWDWWGRLLLRAYDLTLGPATHVLVKHLLRRGVVFYGGNFAARRTALEAIGGFDTTIEFHGEDTNLGRRLFAVGRVTLAYDCYLFTSARRYKALGKGAVFRLYVRNFVSEIVYHRPLDSIHLDVRPK
jgi:glycosyltransferase involved in cell wall biosynthesis